MPFGGLLGSTFNFVFETQMEKLQDGDRLYYLARTAGLNFLTELENNSFAKLVMANTDVTRLPGDIFSTPSFILEVDPTKQFDTDDPATPHSGQRPPRARAHGTIRYTGADHIVLGGTDRQRHHHLQRRRRHALGRRRQRQARGRRRQRHHQRRGRRRHPHRHLRRRQPQGWRRQRRPQRRRRPRPDPRRQRQRLHRRRRGLQRDLRRPGQRLHLRGR